MTTVEKTRCPECHGEVPLPAGVQPSEIIVCASCAAELEVLSTGPAVLALAPEVEEDWGE